jgi:hypothetical protein
MPLDEPGECLCPPCLKAEVKQRIERFVATVTPSQARAGVGRRWARDTEPEAGLDYEIDAQGRLVFTRWYLLKRGECCDSGCRNCPYG